jgi:hypothetical protein
MEGINLLEIQKKAKEIFKQNIMNNMLAFLKNTDNDTSYKKWLMNFNVEEYNLEFIKKSGSRDNKYYHELWDELIEYNGFTLIY